MRQTVNKVTEMGQDIKCRKCGWEWNTNQSEEFDKYICHNCGFDNRTFYDSEPIGKNNLGDIISKLIAPNLQPSNLTYEQWHLVRTPEFKAWFGDWEKHPKSASKVIDENGEPLVVYHVTDKEFNIFDKKKSKGGFFFSANKNRLKAYNKKRILEVFLNIKNPSNDEFNVNGYDGIMDFGEIKIKDASYLYEIIAFYPNQIKLADGTNTTFDANNPDIRYEEGGYFETSNNVKEIAKIDKVEEIYNKVLQGLINSDDGAIYLYDNGIEVTTEIYDRLRNAEESFLKKARGLQVGDIITVKGKHGTDDFKANFRGYTNEGKLVVVYDRGKQMMISKDEYYALGGEFKTPHTIEEIAKRHNVDINVIENALKEGINTEKEHSNDESIAKVITLHHLWESPIYYDKLKQMEQSLNLDEHYEDIQEKYNNGGAINPIMSFRTPTGEPSKLTYLQQVLVRTQAFKNWFGDWETAANQFVLNGRQNYVKIFKNVSKVFDKVTFEPKVVYHGTRTDIEFYVFDVSKKDGFGRPYGYFAHNEEYSENFTTSSQRNVPNSLPFMYKCFANVKNPFFATGNEYYDIQQDADYWIKQIGISIARDKYGSNADDERINQIIRVVKSQISNYVDDTFVSGSASFWMLMAKDINKNFKYFLNNYDYDGIFYVEEIGTRYDVNNPAEFSEAVTIFEPSQVKLADGRNLNFDPMNEDIRFKDGGKIRNVNELEINKNYNMGKIENLRNLLTNNKYAEGGEVVANELTDGNDGKKGGYFEGRSHADGGIKAYNKDTGQMIEVEGQEVIITKGAVNDTKKREFEGEMLTNKEILSKINQSGGGVSFAKGGEMTDSSCGCSGKKYKYGGEMLDDYSIVRIMNEPFNVVNENFVNARAFADMLVQKLK